MCVLIVPDCLLVFGVDNIMSMRPRTVSKAGQAGASSVKDWPSLLQLMSSYMFSRQTTRGQNMRSAAQEPREHCEPRRKAAQDVVNQNSPARVFLEFWFFTVQKFYSQARNFLWPGSCGGSGLG